MNPFCIRLSNLFQINEFGLKLIIWNFSEPAHGKSPADAAGATVKTAAKNLTKVSTNEDAAISNALELVQGIKTKVTMFHIAETELKKYEPKMRKEWKKGLPNTRKIRQIVFDASQKMIYCRMYSCGDCQGTKCEHYPGEYVLTFDEFYQKCTKN